MHRDYYRLVQSSLHGSNLRRDVLYAHLMSALNLRGHVVELGVETGSFSSSLLDRLKELGSTPLHYWMLDPWRSQPFYDDVANRPNDVQARLLQQAAQAVMPHWGVARLLQLESEHGARLFDDGSVDCVYVDGRHDYCGVLADLRTWWPKLREGGILAGNDYGNSRGLGGAWLTCSNGSRIPGSVKRAVRDFFGGLPPEGPGLGDSFVFMEEFVVLKHGPLGPSAEPSAPP